MGRLRRSQRISHFDNKRVGVYTKYTLYVYKVRYDDRTATDYLGMDHQNLRVSSSKLRGNRNDYYALINLWIVYKEISVTDLKVVEDFRLSADLVHDAVLKDPRYSILTGSVCRRNRYQTR